MTPKEPKDAPPGPARAPSGASAQGPPPPQQPAWGSGENAGRHPVRLITVIALLMFCIWLCTPGSDSRLLSFFWKASCEPLAHAYVFSQTHKYTWLPAGLAHSPLRVCEVEIATDAQGRV